MAALTIQRLGSGGLITNYFCTSRCIHCLYNCGPRREKEYITPRDAEDLLKKVRSMGCASVHIGGGEPMLNPSALSAVMDAARKAGVGIDYVETNAAWYTDEAAAVTILEELRSVGLRTLLVSISPFHNAAVPLRKTKGVMSACRETGIQVFPWTRDFLTDLSRLDENRTHTLDEFRAVFGDDYLETVLKRYWIHFGGRALETFRPILPTLTADQIRLKYARSCRNELADTSHFHVDLYGNYIPGLCSGLGFSAEGLGGPLNEGDYPVLTVLWNEGIRGFLEWAEKQTGFAPRRNAYAGKCDLCNDIRAFLVETGAGPFAELTPAGYYEAG